MDGGADVSVPPDIQDILRPAPRSRAGCTETRCRSGRRARRVAREPRRLEHRRMPGSSRDRQPRLSGSDATGRRSRRCGGKAAERSGSTRICGPLVCEATGTAGGEFPGEGAAQDSPAHGSNAGRCARQLRRVSAGSPRFLRSEREPGSGRGPIQESVPPGRPL